jgi:hypothetical protein
MCARREIRILLKALRVAASSPLNFVTLAIVAEVFFIIAMAPKPSMVYLGNKPSEILVVITIFLSLFFGLYLLLRIALIVFSKPRAALFCACALWALLMPVIIGFVADRRYGYRDDDAKHALVAMLYDVEIKKYRAPMNSPPKLIDLGASCYPSYSGRYCWIVVVKYESQDDLDISQDIGTWHSIKSNTLLSVLPSHAEYGEVAVKRIDNGIYSVLSEDYRGL